MSAPFDLMGLTVLKELCYLFASIGSFGYVTHFDEEGNCFQGDLFAEVIGFHHRFICIFENKKLPLDEEGKLDVLGQIIDPTKFNILDDLD